MGLGERAESDGLACGCPPATRPCVGTGLCLALAKEDQLTVEGGVVCFPSSWSLREKLGHSLDFTHSVVPDLNTQLAPRIHKRWRNSLRAQPGNARTGGFRVTPSGITSSADHYDVSTQASLRKKSGCALSARCL
jgi:hypothetical protein